MSVSPNPELLRRTIDLNYANKKRSSSYKWIVVNGILFIIFAYDLWNKCAGHTSVLHYVEFCAAAMAALSMAQHAITMLPTRGPPLPLTPHQRRLLGLSHQSLDGSFREVTPERARPVPEVDQNTSEMEALSLSTPRVWRPPSPPSPHSPHSSHSPHSPHSPQSPHSPHTPYSTSHHSPRYDQDEFIADSRSLADYLKRWSDRSRTEGSEGTEGGWGAGAAAGPLPVPSPPPPMYQIAPLDSESTSEDGGSSGGAGAVGGGGGAGGGAPALWRRLHIDPRRLTEYNLNLRLWVHVTILERLVKAMASLDAAFAAHGFDDVRIGQVSLDRLRAAAAAAGASQALLGLLPFLEPFPDQRYVVQRYRELAHGGCLSNYKWNGGGADWEESRPTDAELILHAFSAYMDAQLGRGAFTNTYICEGKGHVGKGLMLQKVSRSPPHYALVRGEETLEPAAGRNNLWHALLLFLACAAAAEPPALRRLHLGRAGLNMLWIIGR